jgi:hypothetical protein
MRRFINALFVLCLAMPLAIVSYAAPVRAYVGQDQGDSERRVLNVPANGRRRHGHPDRRRHHHRGIKGEFGEAGRSAGRGGKGLGTNVAHGRIVRGGKEFGKGMGGFGKHTGKGIARSVKRAVTP